MYVRKSIQGNEILENGVKGNFCIRKPWPGLCRDIHNDTERFFQTYFANHPGTFLTPNTIRSDLSRVISRLLEKCKIISHIWTRDEIICQNFVK